MLSYFDRSVWRAAGVLLAVTAAVAATACGETARGGEPAAKPNIVVILADENDRTQGIPSEFLPPRLLRDNQASLQGPALSGWTLEPILSALGDRAREFIAQSAAGPQPFFLYLPLTSPHTPLAVNEAWKGRSGLNAYADFVIETDALVGRVLDALDRSGAGANTLVVFTSDNGCAPYIGAADLERRGHFPSGPLRGYKADVWEGGHRVPFVVRWPGVAEPGSASGQLVLQADLMATFADVLGAKLPDNAGEDSFSLVPLLRGVDEPIRATAVNYSANGLPAIRKGRWKLIFGPGSGGWSPSSDAPPMQLYDLADDLGETKNLAAEKPEVVAELTAAMEQLVAAGRSTPGPAQANDVPVAWRRHLEQTKRAGK